MLTASVRRAAGKPLQAAVLGAAGGIGQPLSMLLKLSPVIDRLALYDVAPVTPGVAADLSHIDSQCRLVGGYVKDDIGSALKGSDIVVIPAGVPRKPGMTRDDLFNINAGIVKTLAEACAEHCPTAMFCIISNPVNSTVPIFREVLKAKGVYDKKRLFGVTTLDVCRANTFVAESQGWDIEKAEVPVIGGHAGTTIVPLLSQVEGAVFSDEQLKALTNRIQFGGDEVVKAKDGGGSATLSMALAGAKFVEKLGLAMKGEKGIKACTFVENDVTKLDFFSTPVTLGENGVEEVHHFGSLSALEQANMDEMLPALESQIEKGIAFVKGSNL